MEPVLADAGLGHQLDEEARALLGGVDEIGVVVARRRHLVVGDRLPEGRGPRQVGGVDADVADADAHVSRLLAITCVVSTVVT